MRYTVRKGDTLSGIAEATNAGNWKELWLKNRTVVGHDPDHIEPGQVIEVPFSLKGFLKNLITLKVK